MEQPRLPTASDFAPEHVVTIIPPSKDAIPSNILILLHGLGDNPNPFSQLGARLALPETACLAIRGTAPLPFELGGFHWGDDVIFDNSTGGLDYDTGFSKSHTVLKEVIDGVLLGKCGWTRRAIFFLGFGQGGYVALDMAARLPAKGEDSEYGGVVAIAGAVPHSSPSPQEKAKTPVLMLGAERNSVVTNEAELRAKNVFENVNVVRWSGRSGDGMMKNSDEVKPIMVFLAKRLKSRAGVPKGAVEIGVPKGAGEKS